MTGTGKSCNNLFFVENEKKLLISFWNCYSSFKIGQVMAILSLEYFLPARHVLFMLLA